MNDCGCVSHRSSHHTFSVAGATNLNSPQVVIGPRASSANSACNKRGKKSEKIQIENENKKRQDRIKILQVRKLLCHITVEAMRTCLNVYCRFVVHILSHER